MSHQQQSLFNDGPQFDGAFVPAYTLPPAQQHSETSKAAAKAMTGKPSDLARQKVADAIRNAGERGLTDQECEVATGLSGNCVRPRRIELESAGLVVDSGKRRKTASGRMAVVWVRRGA